MELFWPDTVSDLKHIHNLGQFSSSFSGCHLGCACLHKLGARLHKDPKDHGLCTTAPGGVYKGGCMMIPQLYMVFRCASQLLNGP
jgi:hypothetical protein